MVIEKRYDYQFIYLFLYQNICLLYLNSSPQDCAISPSSAVSLTVIHMCGSRKFCQGGPTLTFLCFSLMRGGRIQIPLLAGHLNGVSLAGR